jgi:hypothetical protein
MMRDNKGILLLAAVSAFYSLKTEISLNATVHGLFKILKRNLKFEKNCFKYITFSKADGMKGDPIKLKLNFLQDETFLLVIL